MKYITRFIRKDGQPNEEYYWNKESDAVKHLELFIDDDSDLYERIEVVDENDRIICGWENFNEETKRAIEEAKAGIGLSGPYTSVDEMIKDIMAEDED